MQEKLENILAGIAKVYRRTCFRWKNMSSVWAWPHHENFTIILMSYLFIQEQKVLVSFIWCQRQGKKCKNISSNLISNLSSQKRSNEYLWKLNHFAVLFPKQNKVKVRKELHITCKYAVAKILKVQNINMQIRIS